MNVYALGASRNIGYYASLRLLDKGARVTFLLRNPSVLEDDDTVRAYVRSGHAKLVKGDALVAADVANGWAVALGRGQRTVDLVIFTVGGFPSFRLTKGIVLEPPNLVTQSLLNVLTTYPTCPSAPPKLITLSSIGLTAQSHANLPLLLKPLYSAILGAAHDDKLGSERVALQAAGKPWPSSYPEIKRGIMPAGWLDALAGNGVVWTETVVVQPALLTDGACKAEACKPEGKLAYRAAEENFKDGYTISRKDVAYFIVEDLLKNWERWSGRSVSVSY